MGTLGPRLWVMCFPMVVLYYMVGDVMLLRNIKIHVVHVSRSCPCLFQELSKVVFNLIDNFSNPSGDQSDKNWTHRVSDNVLNIKQRLATTIATTYGWTHQIRSIQRGRWRARITISLLWY